METNDLIVFFIVIFSFFIFWFTSSCKKEEEKTNQIPTCTITNPQDGQQIVKGETVIVSVEAIDADRTINEVWFAIDGIGRDSIVSFPYKYSWNTADETIGMHTIKATAIDNAGGSKADQVTVEIIEGGDKPVAAYSAIPTSGAVPLTVNFTDLSSNNPTSWHWNFGDGGSSTQQNPAHTFNSAGSYTVELIVSNAYGSDSEVKNNHIIVTTVGGTGEPCPGIPTFTYHGQTYNTVLIGSQCWMKENLNYATGNSWCYDADPANCNIYGRLYGWGTIMNGEASSNSVPSGVQGICPDGWHVPSDKEWIILEGTVDTQYEVSSMEWLNEGWRGEDVGKSLKTVSGWIENFGTDAYGFSAIPGGRYLNFGVCDLVGENALFWSSTEYGNDKAFYRKLRYADHGAFRGRNPKIYGFSLRCVKD